MMNDGERGVNEAQFLPLTVLNDGIGQKSALTLACLSFPLGKATNIEVSKTKNPIQNGIKEGDPQKYF